MDRRFSARAVEGHDGGRARRGYRCRAIAGAGRRAATRARHIPAARRNRDSQAAWRLRFGVGIESLSLKQVHIGVIGVSDEQRNIDVVSR